MGRTSLSRYRAGKVREVSIHVRKLPKKSIELVMAKQARSDWKGVCLNVNRDLIFAKQTNISLGEQELKLKQNFDQQVHFPEKNQMEFIVGFRHRRRS